jgi:hypothetical protein
MTLLYVDYRPPIYVSLTSRYGQAGRWIGVQPAHPDALTGEDGHGPESSEMRSDHLMLSHSADIWNASRRHARSIHASPTGEGFVCGKYRMNDELVCFAAEFTISRD